MNAGELETKKAFEDVIRGNVKTIGGYSTATRKIVREQDKKIERQEKQLIILKQEIDNLRKQLAIIQGIIYKGGTN